MALNLKDLKKFPGNKTLGGEFKFIPVDYRNKTVDDIPHLQPHEVNVQAIIKVGKTVDPKTGKRVRPLRPNLCLVSELPDPDPETGEADQVGYILDLRKQKKMEMASRDEDKQKILTGNEITLDFLIKKYIVAKVSKQTDAKGTHRILKFWQKKLGDYLLDEISAEDIENVLLKESKERNWKEKTYNNNRGPLLQAFKFGMSKACNRIVKHNPVQDVEFKKVNNLKEVSLNDNQRERLFFELAIRTSQKKVFTQKYKDNDVECINPYYKTASKDLSDMVHFGIITGCRIGEALGLHWKDIDRKRSTINFSKAKRRSKCTLSKINEEGKLIMEYEHNVITQGLKNGSALKVIKMQKTLKKILAKRELKSSTELIFPNDCRRSWNSLLKVLKQPDKEGRFGGEVIPDNFNFHALRHCCGSYLVQAGWSLEKTGKYLGHKDIQSTKRYSHLDETTSEEGAEILEERMFAKS
tara:strand:- start:188 stop:1591 length:1404 start_codon:yes stop_codon:yes gene_type:complete